VVDPDIDISPTTRLDWALATRFQADRDLVVHNGMRAVYRSIRRSTPESASAQKPASIFTVAFGRTGMESLIPDVPTYSDRRFPSIRAALEDAQALSRNSSVRSASRDGREIVLELERLRSELSIGRDAFGRLHASKNEHEQAQIALTEVALMPTLRKIFVAASPVRSS